MAKGNGKQHLRPPWKPGQSGNPSGAHKATTLDRPNYTRYLNQIFAETAVTVKGADGVERKVPSLEAWARAHIERGLTDAQFAKVILERIDPVVTNVNLQVNVIPDDAHEYLDNVTITKRRRNGGNGKRPNREISKVLPPGVVKQDFNQVDRET